MKLIKCPFIAQFLANHTYIFSTYSGQKLMHDVTKHTVGVSTCVFNAPEFSLYKIQAH